MEAASILSLLTSAELTLWLLVFAAAIYAHLYKSFSAIVYFLAIKLVVAATYSFIAMHYLAGSRASARAYGFYFDIYWLSYLLGTFAVFFSIEQIMRTVLSPLPGVSRLAVLIFRFTGALTFFVAITAHLPELHNVAVGLWINEFFISIALCMCVFELSLMSMLIAAAPRLGLSFRTRTLGLSLGLCFLGINDFLSLAMWMIGKGGEWAGLNLVNEIAVVGTVLMWITYFLLPEQKRGALRLNRSSQLRRWNEIVNQLGVGPQPVAELTPSFMTDVESVVERIMMRNTGENL